MELHLDRRLVDNASGQLSTLIARAHARKSCSSTLTRSSASEFCVAFWPTCTGRGDGVTHQPYEENQFQCRVFCSHEHGLIVSSSGVQATKILVACTADRPLVACIRLVPILPSCLHPNAPPIKN